MCSPLRSWLFHPVNLMIIDYRFYLSLLGGSSIERGHIYSGLLPDEGDLLAKVTP